MGSTGHGTVGTSAVSLRMLLLLLPVRIKHSPRFQELSLEVTRPPPDTIPACLSGKATGFS